MNTFDKIYILDLHGNSRKKETSIDGTADENIFDIIQGVSINIFIKNKKSNSELASVYHFDLYGKRKEKYDFLEKSAIFNINWTDIPKNKPDYFLVEKNYSLKSEYDEGISIDNLMNQNGVGICSKRDSIAFQNSKAAIKKGYN